MTCLTSKDRNLIRIPRTVAQPFMCEFRCFNRINPATAMLGSHSGAISFQVVVAHVIRKAEDRRSFFPFKTQFLEIEVYNLFLCVGS